MTACHFGEFIKRTGLPVDIHLHFEVRQDGFEICPFCGKLEFAAVSSLRDVRRET